MDARQAFGHVRRFLVGDVSGVGAVEFALVVPILLVLFLGGSELGVALTVDRKVKAAAGAAVDLASQSTKLEDADFRKLMGIARGSIAPYSRAPLALRLTQIRINAVGQGTVDWSCATNGYSKLAKGTPVTVPPQFSAVAQTLLAQAAANHVPPADLAIYIVRGEAQYAFEPVTGKFIGSTIMLSGVSYVQPRYSDSVESLSNGCSPFSIQ